LEDRRLNLPFLVTAILLVVVIVFSIVFYVNTSNNFKSDRTSITDLQGQITTLKSQLAQANTTAATLQTDLNAAKTQVSTLDGKLTTSNTQITTLTDQLNTQVKSISDQIAALQKQVSDSTSLLNSVKNDTVSQGTKITALDTALNTLKTQVTTLETNVTALTTKVNNLSNVANNPVTIISSQSYTATGGATPTYMGTYTPTTYSGYIYVSSTTALTTGYIRAYYGSTSGSYQDYPFSGAYQVSIPVTAGISYPLYFGNTASSGTITAVLSAVFYPGTTGSVNTTTLFSNQAVSQSNGAKTTVYSSFTPSSSGYVTISGISSSSQTYVEFYNVTSVASTVTQVFGTGTTLNFTVAVGNTYNINFYNLNSGSGTVTATLTGIYNRY
jgi:hypothetical protein